MGNTVSLESENGTAETSNVCKTCKKLLRSIEKGYNRNSFKHYSSKQQLKDSACYMPIVQVVSSVLERIDYSVDGVHTNITPHEHDLKRASHNRFDSDSGRNLRQLYPVFSTTTFPLFKTQIGPWWKHSPWQSCCNLPGKICV